MSVTQKYALLSLFDKTWSEYVARRLIEFGYTLIASKGTADHLAKFGIKSITIGEFTGMDPILNHKVVTLHPKLHAGLLADPTNDGEVKQMAELGFPFIDVVWVDLYPIEDAIAAPDATVESVRKNTDIGGVTILRSAAKGLRLVTAMREHMLLILKWLEGDKGLHGRTTEENLRLSLASYAEIMSSAHSGSSGQYLANQSSLL